MALSGLVLFVAAAACVLVAYALGWVLGPRSTSERRLARALERGTRASIDRTSDGAVAKVVGKVVPIDQALRAPFSEEPCVLYGASLHASDVATPIATLRAREPTDELLRAIRGQDFIVEDGASRVRVVVDPARVHLVGDATTTPASEISERARRFAESTGGDPEAAQELACSELAVRAGDVVCVLGKLGTEVGALPGEPSFSAGYREAPTHRTLTSFDELIVSTDPTHSDEERTGTGGARAAALVTERYVVAIVLSLMFGPAIGWLVGGSPIGDFHPDNWRDRLFLRIVFAAVPSTLSLLLFALHLGRQHHRNGLIAAMIGAGLAATTAAPALGGLWHGPIDRVVTVRTAKTSCARKSGCALHVVLTTGEELELNTGIAKAIRPGEVHLEELKELDTIIGVREAAREPIQRSVGFAVTFGVLWLAALASWMLHRRANRRTRWLSKLTGPRPGPWIRGKLQQNVWVYLS